MSAPGNFPTIDTYTEHDERAVIHAEHAKVIAEWDSMNFWDLIFANIGIGIIHALLEIAAAIRDLKRNNG